VAFATGRASSLHAVAAVTVMTVYVMTVDDDGGSTRFYLTAAFARYHVLQLCGPSFHSFILTVRLFVVRILRPNGSYVGLVLHFYIFV
jgi:hypothetical protein